ALRVPRGEAPRIDGDLSDPIWARAPEIGPFTQVEPVEGAPPTERTAVRILFDERRLYLGIWCFDADPGGIVATQMRRDARLDPDDRVEIVIDTFRDRRNAYFFQIGPAGGPGDALVTNNGSDFNKDWDGIWEGISRIAPEGWFGEVAIPFRTLAFDARGTTWGLNINRILKRREEQSRWAAARQHLSLFRISEAGDLEGLEGLEQGVGLDLVPYLRADADRTHDSAGRDLDLLLRGGGEAFYRLTPGITATATVRPDFAETEVDDQRVNLTRFPLFFPEKRKFFLEDAGIFSFETGGGDFDGPPELLPFFSRRIGIDEENRPVPLRGGAKVSGREGPWSIGCLGVETKEKHEISSQDLFAARVRRNLGEGSVLGLVATRGNPADTGENSLLGLDYKFSTSAFAGGRNLDVVLYGLHSWTEGTGGEEAAYGIDLAYPNDVWEARLGARAIEEDFFPALGFVERPGTRRYSGAFSWNPRPGGAVRQVGLGVAPDLFTDDSGRTESFALRADLPSLNLESGDEGGVLLTPTYERLEAPFEILEGITIPEGSYDFVRFGAFVETSDKRPLSATAGFEAGEFFDGRRLDLEFGLAWRPSGRFNASGEYEQTRLETPFGAAGADADGDFTVRIGRLRTEVNFSPAVSWQTLAQFDNVSRTAGVNTRLRWILRPGQDLFLVFNRNQPYGSRPWNAVTPVPDPGESPPAIVTQGVVKLAYTIRF
ncbi:MAG: DUF5916 domain-containing protein, partial [Planctomycetota bacterium]